MPNWQGATPKGERRMVLTYEEVQQDCGCTKTYNNEKDADHTSPIMVSVCKFHAVLKTCNRCFALVLPEHWEKHIDWHFQLDSTLAWKKDK